MELGTFFFLPCFSSSSLKLNSEPIKLDMTTYKCTGLNFITNPKQTTTNLETKFHHLRHM